MWRLRVRPSQSSLRGPRETPPGSITWVRSEGLMGADERRCKPAESRAFRKGGPCPFQEAVSRSKEKRRSGAPRGAPVRVMDRQSRPLTGWVLPQGGPTVAAIRGREFRRSATLALRGEGFETDNWNGSPPGCAARECSRTGQTHSKRKADVEMAEPNIGASRGREIASLRSQ